MVYSKNNSTQVCVLIVLILLITSSFLRELQHRRSFKSEGQIEIRVVAPQEWSDCRLTTRYFYLTVDSCESLKRFQALSIIGRVEQNSDDDIFLRKRLMIQEVKPYWPGYGSINDWRLKFELWLSQVRGKVYGLVFNTVPQPEAGLLIALLLGQDEFLTKSIEPLFKNTGTLHILAASGMHLSIVIGLLESLLPKNLYFTVRGAVLLACVLCYLLVVGLQPSMVRAVGMSLHYLVSRYILKRGYNHLFSLFFISSGLLIIWPEWLFSPGYQLSVMATFAVVGIHPFAKRIFQIKRPNRIFHSLNKVQKLVHSIRQNSIDELSVGLIAQLSVAPIVLLHFGSMPLLGFMSSSLVQWYVPFLTQTGLLATLLLVVLSTWFPAAVLEQLAVVLLWLPASFFLSLMRNLARYDWMNIHIQ